MTDPCSNLDLETPVDIAAAIDERDITLVQKTWMRAAGLGAETVGKVLFMQILNLAPDAVGLFPFKDYPQERLFKVGSPLIEYGAKIVNTLNVAIAMLNDLPALVPVLQTALPDLFPGAQKEHYGVVGQAALNSLSIALGGYWQPPVKHAWLKIWTTVVSVMFPEEVPAKSAGSEVDAKQEESDAKKTADEASAKAAEVEKAHAETKKKAVPKKRALTLADVKVLNSKSERLAFWKGLNAKDKLKWSDQVCQSCSENHLAAVKDAVLSGFDANAQNAEGATPLIMAAQEGHIDVVTFLVEEAEAKVSVTNGNQDTPLHMACKWDQKVIAEYLINKAADKTVKNKQKKTPADIAKGDTKVWLES